MLIYGVTQQVLRVDVHERDTRQLVAIHDNEFVKEYIRILLFSE